MRVRRVFNQALFKQVLTKPRLWAAISEDGSVAIEDYSPDLTHIIALALIGEEDKLHGFLIGRPFTDSVIEVHIAIDPDLWGHKDNVQLGSLGCRWLFEEYPDCIKLVAAIPTTDVQVLRYAQRVGFQREGVNKASFRRNGEVLDQFYVGLKRPAT